MIDGLKAASRIAGSGLAAQSVRLRVVSENLANANSTGQTPGAEPYQRKTVTFKGEMNRALGVELVKMDRLGKDKSPFRLEFEPGHPAADESGFVKLPNVRMMIEMADLREANRSYEANLAVIRQTRELTRMTLDLLRS